MVVEDFVKLVQTSSHTINHGNIIYNISIMKNMVITLYGER